MTVTERFEIDRTANTITLRRTIRSTPERLFDAWTRPDQVSRWWDPTGAPLAGCEIDLRVGGTFRFTNTGREAHPFEGRYTVLERPERIGFEAMGAVGTVTFASGGAVTHMTVTMACASAEHLEQFIAMGIADGTSQTLGNLKAWIEASG